MKKMSDEKERRAEGQKPWFTSYPEGVPSVINVPQLSLSQAFARAAEKWKERTAIIFYGKRISYRELSDLVDRFASALYGLGVKKGDRIALFLLNCPQFAIAYFAALKIGAIVAPISPLSVTPELKRQLEDSKADTIVCQDILYEFVEKSDTDLKNVIVAGVGDYLPAMKRFVGKSFLKVLYQKMGIPRIRISEAGNVHLFETLIEKSQSGPPSIDVKPTEDVAVLSYTAGTTQEAKAVLLTHYNLLAVHQMSSAFWSRSFEKGKGLEEGQEVSLAVMPFSHIYGQAMVLLGGLLHGYTLVMLTTPDLDDIVTAVGRYRVTLLITVPSLYSLLNDYEKADRIDWRGLKLAVSVADSLSPETATSWEKRRGITIHEGYGLTETGSAVSINPSGRGKRGSLGIPLPGTVLAVAHPESSDFVPPGDIGELVVKGPHLMKSYWKGDAEGPDGIVEIVGERWVRTGDLGRMDDDGYFHFYERKRDLIPVQGDLIYAREIEDAIKTHPMVKEAAVIGIPDNKAGTAIKAVIIVRNDARGKLSDEMIIKHCREKLPDHKVPRVIEFRGEIPKTDVGKVSRRELREERSLI